MRNFICISGKAQNGKDTVAKIFKHELVLRGFSVLVIHQADLLKFICKSFFKWNGEKDAAGRTLLQQIGTNIIRKAEPDFWVNFIAKVTGFFKEEWDYIIIPDTRFPNELDKLKTDDSNVFHVRIIRPNFKSPLSEDQQRHPSETALDDVESDFTIINDKGIEDLCGCVVSTLDSIVAGLMDNKH